MASGVKGSGKTKQTKKTVMQQAREEREERDARESVAERIQKSIEAYNQKAESLWENENTSEVVFVAPDPINYNSQDAFDAAHNEHKFMVSALIRLAKDARELEETGSLGDSNLQPGDLPVIRFQRIDSEGRPTDDRTSNSFRFYRPRTRSARPSDAQLAATETEFMAKLNAAPKRTLILECNAPFNSPEYLHHSHLIGAGRRLAKIQDNKIEFHELGHRSNNWMFVCNKVNTQPVKSEGKSPVFTQADRAAA